MQISRIAESSLLHSRQSDLIPASVLPASKKKKEQCCRCGLFMAMFYKRHPAME